MRIRACTRACAGPIAVGVVDGPSVVGQRAELLLDARRQLVVLVESASIWPSSIRASSA
jgi:hypothetical protein